MAQKRISLRDRAIVKSRLARGFSLTDAMKGTRIASTSTVWKISQEEASDIERWKLEFLAMITGFGGDEETQARQLAKAVTAQSPFGKDAVLHEDWDAQLKAIQYLHKLRGVNVDQDRDVTVNILNNPDFIKTYDER